MPTSSVYFVFSFLSFPLLVFSLSAFISSMVSFNCAVSRVQQCTLGGDERFARVSLTMEVKYRSKHALHFTFCRCVGVWEKSRMAAVNSACFEQYNVFAFRLYLIVVVHVHSLRTSVRVVACRMSPDRLNVVSDLL